MPPLSEAELYIGRIIWGWIFFSSFLFAYLVDRCITKLRALGEVIEGIPIKKSWLDTRGGFKFAIFLFRRKSQSTDSDQLKRLFIWGRTLEIIYAIQLLIVFFFFLWFTS